MLGPFAQNVLLLAPLAARTRAGIAAEPNAVRTVEFGAKEPAGVFALGI